MPGVQTLVPIMLDHVAGGRLSLERFVDLTSAGPARIFGIAGKGRIAVGYDADFTVSTSSAAADDHRRLDRLARRMEHMQLTKYRTSMAIGVAPAYILLALGLGTFWATRRVMVTCGGRSRSALPLKDHRNTFLAPWRLTRVLLALWGIATIVLTIAVRVA